MSSDINAAAVEKAIALARALQTRASELQTPAERRQQAELDRMLQTPADKTTLVQLTDQAFRCKAARRTAEHLTHILDAQGVPRFFSPLDRTLLLGFQTFGGWLPGVAVPLVKGHMQSETANVVLPAEPEVLTQHLAARRAEGVRMNVNLLGEALLGEAEAAHRLEKYLAALGLPEVEVISVKISTLYSQISPAARQHTLRLLCQRLEQLYLRAAQLRFIRPDGTSVAKFIYLDMEEYRDLHLTAAAFMRTLDRPALKDVQAGIALQAYVPDSARVQQQLNTWARQRVAAGGAPITIRIVKGANMEAERVEAAVRDWPQAPYRTKRETDANFKRMLRVALNPENLPAVCVGVASHNLFDLAYGLVLAAQVGAGNRVQFEMLEGMANHQRRALLELSRHLLLYAPACRKEEFLNAIGYLIRRLDENTGPENFLRHAFKLEVGSPDWEDLERGFRDAFAVEISDAPRRTQSRLTERFAAPRARMNWPEFINEPDTDWSLPQNGEWAEQIVARKNPSRSELPLVIAGIETPLPASGGEPGARAIGECRDPSRPGIVVARFTQANAADLERAVACAKADPAGWRALPVAARDEILGRVAQEIRKARADLMWAALANGGKTLAESDPEVSEAVDFVEFYRASAHFFFKDLTTIRASPRGVAVVVPPWNFPIAIPCGGIAAALAASNTVILKPASDAVLVAWELCECFWRAGVPRTALQFAPCPGSTAGQALIAHPDVDLVILTGGTSTALRMLTARPALRLFAETGGKNATIVTALSDRELAVKHVLQSAFSHSGQKCSATSLLLLEAEIYDDDEFKRMLCDAVKSLPVGSAWELETRVGPLIRPPTGDLETAFTRLEPGESWAVQPAQVGDNPNLWSPGVKYGAQPDSYTHCTEFFGPVLGVMRFETLAEAIVLVNRTGYGLTSGLHSLDEREHSLWRDGVQAGNLYMNRSTVGAVVLRQPFGGVGRSGVGPGMKAGGPNYLVQFMKFEEEIHEQRLVICAPEPTPDLSQEGNSRRASAVPLPSLGRVGVGGSKAAEAFAAANEPLADPDLESLRRALLNSDDLKDKSKIAGQLNAQRLRLLHALASYDHWWREEFGREHDHFRLLGQDNLRRYRFFAKVRVRIAAEDTLFDLFARAAAARVMGALAIISAPPQTHPAFMSLLKRLTEKWATAIEFIEETDEQLAARVRNLPPHNDERVRFGAPGRVPTVVRAVAAGTGVYLADEPVLAEGRIELLWYLREQSLSHDYHRYGNLGARAGEKRREPF